MLEELLHQRGDLAGPQRELFQQLDAAAAAAADGEAKLFLFLLGLGAAKAVPVGVVPRQHLADGAQVQRDTLADGPLVGHPLVGADLHRPVEGEVPIIDLLEDLDGALKAVVALEHLGPEDLAGDFDLLGQGDFLLAGEQGDLAHLGQVHPDRVIDPLGGRLGELGFEVQVDLFAVFVADDFDDFFLGGDLLLLGRPGLGAFGKFADVGLVDELDAHLVDHHKERIEFVGAYDLVGQLFVQLLVGQIAARGAHVEQGADAEVHLLLRAGADQRRIHHRFFNAFLDAHTSPITLPARWCGPAASFSRCLG